MKHFQPAEHISIDEKMVQNKWICEASLHGFRPYMKDKPTKWGMKLWVVADAVTGYTYDFEVYTRKSRSAPSKVGLWYVCMNLRKKKLFE